MLLTDAANIAALIRSLRHQFQLSQADFAAQLGVSDRGVNRWENGHATPSPMALKLIKNLRHPVEHPPCSDRD